MQIQQAPIAITCIDGNNDSSILKSANVNLNNGSRLLATTATVLNPVSIAEKYKTEQCKSFEIGGYCKYGAKCQYAHGLAEVRARIRHPKYKTELCNNYLNSGECRYGDRCLYIHEKDLKNNLLMKYKINDPQYQQNQNSSSVNQEPSFENFTSTSLNTLNPSTAASSDEINVASVLDNVATNANMNNNQVLIKNSKKLNHLLKKNFPSLVKTCTVLDSSQNNNSTNFVDSNNICNKASNQQNFNRSNSNGDIYQYLNLPKISGNITTAEDYIRRSSMPVMYKHSRQNKDGVNEVILTPNHHILAKTNCNSELLRANNRSERSASAINNNSRLYEKCLYHQAYPLNQNLHNLAFYNNHQHQSQQPAYLLNRSRHFSDTFTTSANVFDLENKLAKNNENTKNQLCKYLNCRQKHLYSDVNSQKILFSNVNQSNDNEQGRRYRSNTKFQDYYSHNIFLPSYNDINTPESIDLPYKENKNDITNLNSLHIKMLSAEKENEFENKMFPEPSFISNNKNCDINAEYENFTDNTIHKNNKVSLKNCENDDTLINAMGILDLNQSYENEPNFCDNEDISDHGIEKLKSVDVNESIDAEDIDNSDNCKNIIEKEDEIASRKNYSYDCSPYGPIGSKVVTNTALNKTSIEKIDQGNLANIENDIKNVHLPPSAMILKNKVQDQYNVEKLAPINNIDLHNTENFKSYSKINGFHQNYSKNLVFNDFPKKYLHDVSQRSTIFNGNLLSENSEGLDFKKYQTRTSTPEDYLSKTNLDIYDFQADNYDNNANLNAISKYCKLQKQQDTQNQLIRNNRNLSLIDLNYRYNEDNLPYKYDSSTVSFVEQPLFSHSLHSMVDKNKSLRRMTMPSLQNN